MESTGALSRWYDRLIASDPGLERLRTALRALLSVGASAALLVPIAARAGHPATYVLIGCILSMMSGVAVRDPEPRQQRRTLAIVTLTAAVSATVATLVSPNLWLSLTIFCVVIFVSTAARRFGPRGAAAGMLAFMSYFYVLFTKATPAELAWTLGSILAGMVVAALVRFFIVREKPAKMGANLRHAFGARLSDVLERLAGKIGDAATTEDDWDGLRMRASSLDEIALALEGAAGRPDPHDASDGSGAWSAEIFESELAAEMLIDACAQLVPGIAAVQRRRVHDAVVATRRFVREGGDAAEEARRMMDEACLDTNDRDDALTPVRRRARYAVRRLIESRPWTEPPPGAERERPTPVMGVANPSGPGEPTNDWPSALRLAAQATIAGALSIVAGRAISTTRWYWAVIAAFVVFVQATTAGETVGRAWKRVLGTIIGVVIGFGLAELVGHDTPVAIAMALVAMGIAFYLLQSAYAGMIAFFTVALALFYEALGRPVPGLLRLRLLETLAGAAIGVLVSAVVLPQHGGEKMRALVAALLRAAAKPIARATASDGAKADEARELIAAIRGVDSASIAVHRAAGKHTSARLSRSTSSVRELARNAEAAAYAVRRLGAAALYDVLHAHDADGFGAADAHDSSGPEVMRLQNVGEQLVEECMSVADALEHPGVPQLQQLEPRLEQLRRSSPTGPRRMLIEALAEVDHKLHDIAASANRAAMPGGASEVAAQSG